MNDEFLHVHRKPPRREFAQALYARLTQNEMRKPMFTQSNPVKRLATAFAVVCLALIMTFAVSPGARAKLIEVVSDIGGMAFTETTDYPGSGGPVKTFPEKKMSLEQARQTLPFEIQLPTYVPEGFVLDEENIVVMAAEGYSLQYITLGWVNKSTHGAVHMHIWNMLYESRGAIIGPGSVEEVFVHDQPAALVHGAWNADTKEWGAPGLLELRWVRGDQTYSLSAHETKVSAEELIKMAESIP